MNSSQISTSGGMSASQQKEAIRIIDGLMDFVRWYEKNIDDDLDYHQPWASKADNFLASLKEPEDSGYCCPACGRPYIKEPDDRCPSCGNKGEIPAFYGRGGEAFMRPCPDPWHDQKEESE
jgi:hypothetical protein